MSAKGYGIIPRWLFGEVSGISLAVYAVLAVHASEHGICWPSLATLARDSGFSKPTVIKGIKELEEVGVVITHQRCDEERGQQSNVYQVRMYRDGAPAWGSDPSAWVIQEEEPVDNLSTPVKDVDRPLSTSFTTPVKDVDSKSTNENYQMKREGYVRNATPSEPVDNFLSPETVIEDAPATPPPSNTPAPETEPVPTVVSPDPVSPDPDLVEEPSAHGGVLPMVCPAHQGVLAPPPCRACQAARVRWEAHAAIKAREREKAKREQERAEREAHKAELARLRADPQAQAQIRAAKAAARSAARKAKK